MFIVEFGNYFSTGVYLTTERKLRYVLTQGGYKLKLHGLFCSMLHAYNRYLGWIFPVTSSEPADIGWQRTVKTRC